jgi:DNA-binding transcriptional ArsR family regulator
VAPVPSDQRRRGRPPRRDVRLRDPAALRALAHPARLTVVDELYQGSERTSSELAQLTGLTPSAMSYHLRALERWGIVERAAPRGDGRERPWRASGRSLSFVTDLSGTAVAAKDAVAGNLLQRLREELHAWSLAEDNEPGVWRELAGIHRSVLWLDAAEAEAFSEEVRAVIERYDAEGRDAADHLQGTRRLVVVLALAPAPSEPIES